MTQLLSYGRQPDKRLQALLGLILHGAIFFTILGLVIQINYRITKGHSGDFRHFYFAAGALLDHRDMYGDFPLDVVQHALGRPAGSVEKAWYTTDTDRYLYPPMIAMFYTPLARLRFDHAQRVSLVINALLAYAGILLTVRVFVERFDLSRAAAVTGAIGLLGMLLNVDKIHADLQMFQTNSLMFFMFALSMFLLDRKPVVAGIPLGFIFNIKYLSLGLLPWLLIRRRFKTAGGYVASALFFAFVPALISGWHENLHDLGVAYGGLLHMVGIGSASAEQANVDNIRDYLSCSITSAMARTTRPGESLLKPAIYTVAILLAAVGVVLATYRQRHLKVLRWPAVQRQIDQPWKAMVAVEFVCIVAATLCFSPQTNTRHLMMVLLITIPLSAMVLFARSAWARTVAIIGALLIGVGFIYPLGGQAPGSHRLAMQWFGIGGQCWCLLVAIFALVWSGEEMQSAECRVQNEETVP